MRYVQHVLQENRKLATGRGRARRADSTRIQQLSAQLARNVLETVQPQGIAQVS